MAKKKGCFLAALVILSKTHDKKLKPDVTTFTILPNILEAFFHVWPSLLIIDCQIKHSLLLMHELTMLVKNCPNAIFNLDTVMDALLYKKQFFQIDH